MTTTYLSLANVAPGRYIGFMRSVGLKVLKNKLSEYVRLVANGETVLVTDRDRVVAELVPPRPGRSPLLADAQLASAVREWVLRVHSWESAARDAVAGLEGGRRLAA